MRACPYCASTASKFFGRRDVRTYVRCIDCGSVFMDMQEEEFDEILRAALTNETFVENVHSDLHGKPDFAKYEEFSSRLPNGKLLEIGPGTGSFLAAAKERGRPVAGVELSQVHRSFIQGTWGIETWASFDDVPSEERYSAAVMFNVVEHLYHPDRCFQELRKRLVPGGVVLVSTCNAGALVSRICRSYWSMYKQRDHVSVASAKGLKRLAERTGFRSSETWFGEYPLETPIGFALAGLDFLRERRAHGGASEGSVDLSAAETAAAPAGQTLLHRGLLLAREVGRYDPIRVATELTGLAGAVRCLATA